jgi:hypothetical protein
MKWLQDYRFRDWSLVERNGKPIYETRYKILDGGNLEKTGDLYYTLFNGDQFMNVRIRDDLIIEYYPGATDDDLKTFGIKPVHPLWSAPYFSKTYNDEITHIYQVLDQPGQTIIGRWNINGIQDRYYRYTSQAIPYGLEYMYEIYNVDHIILYYNGPGFEIMPLALLMG